MQSLKDKHVLVVGGSEGIGLSVAEAAQAAGAQLYVASRSEHKLQQAAVRLGNQAFTFPVDYTQEESVARLFSFLPQLDHLVVTAIGKTGPALMTDLPVAEAQAVFSAKVWGTYRVIRHALAKLPEDGSITLFSGNFSIRPSPGWAVLASANGAIEALGRALAVELSPRRVNVIRPGLVNTPAYENLPLAMRQRMFDQYAATVPARKVGQAEEIAQAVLFALTNPYLSGTILSIDGGAHLV